MHLKNATLLYPKVHFFMNLIDVFESVGRNYNGACVAIGVGIRWEICRLEKRWMEGRKGGRVEFEVRTLI